MRAVLGSGKRAPRAARPLTANSAAILAETRGGELQVDSERLAAVDTPTLVVSATDSPAVFRTVAETLAASIPDARAVAVGGGHLIDPSHPAILAFVAGVLAGDT